MLGQTKTYGLEISAKSRLIKLKSKKVLIKIEGANHNKM